MFTIWFIGVAVAFLWLALRGAGKRDFNVNLLEDPEVSSPRHRR